MLLSIGTLLGPYEILAPLGAGGMGEVYKARDRRLGRDVAVKVLPETFGDTASKDRFQREARAASSLSHPNICAIFDIGESGGHPYLVMELLGGETLKQHIQFHQDSPHAARHACHGRWRDRSVVGSGRPGCCVGSQRAEGGKSSVIHEGLS